MAQKAAVNFCENEVKVPAHLIEINSAEENKAIQAEMNRRPAIYVWLGITDKHSEGNWTLQSTGESVAYTNWGTNEPNNDRSKEHCAYMECGGHWNDMICSIDRWKNGRNWTAVCEQTWNEQNY